MKKTYHATIKWRCKVNHPDTDDTKTVFTYSDDYYIDDDYFEDEDAIMGYIKHDLALVAGGGYDTDTITDVKYNIARV